MTKTPTPEAIATMLALLKQTHIEHERHWDESSPSWEVAEAEMEFAGWSLYLFGYQELTDDLAWRWRIDVNRTGVSVFEEVYGASISEVSEKAVHHMNNWPH